MTSKELLYIKDALGHEKYFKEKCKETSEQLTDSNLKQFVCQLQTKHEQTFNNFYNLI